MKGTVEFRFRDEAHLDAQLASVLRKHGWQCVKDKDWETPKAVAARYGIATPQTLTMRLMRYKGTLIAERGPSKRILRLIVTPDLDAYFKKLNGTKCNAL